MRDTDALIIRIADFLIERQATVRSAAAEFGMGKSTVHKYMTQRLKDLDGTRYAAVKELLAFNLATRHLRGGEAVKQKYLSKK